MTETGTTMLTVEVAGVRERVVAARGANISRGPVGPLRDFASFVVGDRVAVEGDRTDGVWAAHSVGTAFDTFDGHVESVDDEAATMETDAEALDIRRLVPGPGRLGRSEIGVGQEVAGLMWQDPASAVREAVLVVRR